MSDRDFFMALVIAATSSGSSDPLKDALRVFEDFKTLEKKGRVPL